MDNILCVAKVQVKEAVCQTVKNNLVDRLTCVLVRYYTPRFTTQVRNNDFTRMRGYIYVPNHTKL